MAIYTSYFVNVETIPEFYILYSIAQQTPTWVYRNIIQIDNAKPSWQLIRKWKSNQISWQQYEQLYFTQVEHYLSEIATMLAPNSVLLCWESPLLNCHRHTLAKLLNNEFNLHIREWEVQQ